MHESSMEVMNYFKEKYLAPRSNDNLLILDLGSNDINGSYRAILDNAAWKYVGVDMAEGNNVDVVLRTPYRFREIKSKSIDVLVSGQAFEHIEYFWITMLEIARILKPGAVCCIIAPSSGPEHRYPVDCWRFYSDGLMALARFAGLDILDAYTQRDGSNFSDGSDLWNDSVLICRKPKHSLWRSLKTSIRRSLIYYGLSMKL